MKKKTLCRLALMLAVFLSPAALSARDCSHIGIAENSGADFVLEACGILENNYYNADSLDYPKLLNRALIGVEFELEKYDIVFFAEKIPPDCSKERAKEEFICEFERAQIISDSLSDTIGHNLEFAAADFMLDAIDDSHCFFEYPSEIAACGNAGAFPWELKEVKNGDSDYIYLHLTTFDFGGRSLDSLTRSFKTLIDCSDACGVIVDVRGNYGGYVSTLQSLLELFLEKGTFEFYQVGSRRDTIKYIDTADQVTDLPITVLVDNRSSSASEIFASVLQDNGRALIVGQKTAGAVNVSRMYLLPFGAEMSVSVGQFFTHDGKKLEKTGVTPDIFAHSYTDGIFYRK